MPKDMNLLPHRGDSDTIYLHMHALKHQITTSAGILNYTKFWPEDLFYIVILPQVMTLDTRAEGSDLHKSSKYYMW